MLETIPAAPGDLTFVYRASRDDDVIFRDELEAIARQRGARLRYVTGRRSELGSDPLSAAALVANIPDVAYHDVYVCGPNGMMASVIEALRAAGVPSGHIHHESFEF
jgi:ferredoxin-NADP reductase